MEISISKKFNFAELRVYRFFPSNFTYCVILLIYDSVVNLEKCSFSPIELFSKGTEFVERHSLYLFFPLSLFLSPLIRHLSTLRFILHPPQEV